MNTLLVNLLGWVGAIILLGGYGLISFKNYSGNSVVYQSLNVVGSALLIINTIYFGAYPSAFVNVIWIGIAILAIVRIRKNSQRVRTSA
jgi:hypothetical protein